MIPLLNREGMMKGFVQGADRRQATLLPEYLDDWVDESNPVRAVDVFVNALELRDLGSMGSIRQQPVGLRIILRKTGSAGFNHAK
jgi:transposase